MKHNLLLIIGLIAFLFPMSLKAQETPKISGFVQGLYEAHLAKESGLIDNTLRMRRVRVSLDGNFTDAISYKIQGDFSRSPMLVDAYVKYKASKAFAIQVGQFKMPFSMESPINPVNLEIFDYGESVQSLVGYKDICGVGSLGRDLGVMASGEFLQLEGKDYPLITYNIGLFNGNGANKLDNNNRKDIVGRLDVHPMMKELTLSGSFYLGKYNNETEGDSGTRNRWSAGAQYKDGNIMVRAEYLSGTTGHTYYDGVINDNNEYIEVEKQLFQLSQGYYALAGYTFHFGKGFSQKITPVVRFEHFAPGDFEERGSVSTNYYTVGFDYWPVKSLNFKLDYSLVQEYFGESYNSHRIVGILSYKF